MPCGSVIALAASIADGTRVNSGKLRGDHFKRQRVAFKETRMETLERGAFMAELDFLLGNLACLV